MGNVVGGMAMSLDGIADGNDGQLGRLYQWLFDEPGKSSTDVLNELGVIEPIGAVVMGRKTYDMNPDGDWTAYEFQMPIFVITHKASDMALKADMPFTFVTEGGVESAIKQAKAAAGDKDVVIVGGMSTICAALKAGLMDELHVDIVPVLLGKGGKLFDEIGIDPIDLEIINVVAAAGVTHLKYRVKKG